jgi:hypothetical protein
MRYVVAGYVVVLGILFLYAVQLLWRRRRLTRTALRIDSRPPDRGPSGTAGTTPTAGTAGAAGRSDGR